MPSVQVSRCSQRLDRRLPRKPRKAILHGIRAACPTVFSGGGGHPGDFRKGKRRLAGIRPRRGGNIARLPENGQGNADLGRCPARSRQEACSAVSQDVFFSPRFPGRPCGYRRTWEPTGSPAHSPDPHFHYISPARHAPQENVSGKRIREPSTPCGRGGMGRVLRCPSRENPPPKTIPGAAPSGPRERQ